MHVLRHTLKQQSRHWTGEAGGRAEPRRVAREPQQPHQQMKHGVEYGTRRCAVTQVSNIPPGLHVFPLNPRLE